MFLSSFHILKTNRMILFSNLFMYDPYINRTAKSVTSMVNKASKYNLISHYSSGSVIFI